MPNREKVMEALEKCSFRMMCYQCPYRSPNDSRCQRELMYDALALLKEQEQQIAKLKKSNEFLKGKADNLMYNMQAVLSEMSD